MDNWDIIDSADIDDDDGMLYLSQQGSSYAIYVDGRMLMDNTAHGSEVALADLACSRVAGPVARRVLVGGLGMGFTLAAALRCVPEDGEVVVAELSPAVVRWNQGPAGGNAGHPQLDPRTRVFEGDVADCFEGPDRGYCAILLDVDNGPNALTRPINGWLYTDHGLSRARRALRPGGVLAIWSSHDDPELTERLIGGGFEVELIPFHEPGRDSFDGKSTDMLWMARRG